MVTRTVGRVAVVGGGVVGLCAAHFLDRAGYRVTVVERAKVGGGASWGNAGELATDLAVPLPGPGMIREALRSLTNPDGALYIPPRANGALLRFLVGFSKNATRARYMRGVRSIARLSQDSLAMFTELDTTGAIAGKDGYVYAYASIANARAGLQSKQEIGAPVSGGLLDQAALAALEPALGSAAAAGFLVEDQWWIDPVRFVDGLASDLRERGVEIVEGARVTSIQDRGQPVVVHTTAGDLETDAVVLAAGIETRALCRGFGVDLNLFPGKGYSFSVAADPVPRRVVNVGDAHVVFTPMSGRVRVAGTMELDSDSDAFRPNRIAAIVNAASPYLKSADWENRTNEWVGTRVLTPDGLPAIGYLPGTTRVVVATGHNMMGLVLAPSTGRAITNLLTTDGTPDLARPFDPRRLARPFHRK